MEETMRQNLGIFLIVIGIMGGLAILVLGIGIGDSAARYSVSTLPDVAKLTVQQRRDRADTLTYRGIYVMALGITFGVASVWCGSRLRSRP